MKYTLFYLLALGLFLSGCEKDDGLPVPIYEAGPMTYGSVTAKKNGVDFSASAIAFINTQPPYDVGFKFGTESVNGFRRESVRLNDIKYEAKTYAIGPYDERDDGVVGPAYATLTDDGDVQEDVYRWDETATDNFLTVSEIDTVANIMKGTFTITFVIDPDREKRNPANPDKVVFSDAEFEASFFE